jgi:hypothetical protein
MSWMQDLDSEWREAYEASIRARTDYRVLAASPAASVTAIDMARERLDRAEAVKERVMAKIDRLEASRLGWI